MRQWNQVKAEPPSAKVDVVVFVVEDHSTDSPRHRMYFSVRGKTGEEVETDPMTQRELPIVEAEADQVRRTEKPVVAAE